MYGKKRLTIEKGGLIVIQGEKTYNPIGRFVNVDGKMVGKIRKVENPWETRLDGSNSVDFKVSNATELRKFVKEMYKEELKPLHI